MFGVLRKHLDSSSAREPSVFMPFTFRTVSSVIDR